MSASSSIMAVTNGHSHVLLNINEDYPLMSDHLKHIRHYKKNTMVAAKGTIQHAPRTLLGNIMQELLNCLALDFASPGLQNQKEAVLDSVLKFSIALEYASLQLRGRSIIQVGMVELQKNYKAVTFALPEMNNDEDSVLDDFRNRIPPVVRNCKELMFSSRDLKTNLEIASSTFQERRIQNNKPPNTILNDKATIMTAVKNDLDALRTTSKELKNDDEVALVTAKQSGVALENSSLELRNNKDVVIEAVKSNPAAFRYASPLLRKDFEVVMVAVQSYGMALEYASFDLQNNKEVVIAAAKNSYQAIKFASRDLQNDVEVIFIAGKKVGIRLEHASLELRNNKHIVLESIKCEPESIKFATPLLKNDPEVVLGAVRRNGMTLEHASPQLQNSKEVVMKAVKNQPYAIKFASLKLRNDKEVALSAVNTNPDAIKYVQEDLKRDRDVLIATGMFDANHNDGSQRMKTANSRATKAVLSTRFSLNETSHSKATSFTKLLKEHEYINTGNFKIYAPNAFNKKSCDANWTDFNHPCRGTKKTCKFNNKLTQVGRPTDDCCWRYSFRSQLEEAKATGGFMLQLVETAERFGTVDRAKLGEDQTIEKEMAKDLNLKIFHVYCPTGFQGGDDFKGSSEHEFDCKSIDHVVSTIKYWYASGCQDMSLCEIYPRSVEDISRIPARFLRKQLLRKT